MKIQRLTCKTCGAVFAICRDEYADAGWYKDVAKYLGQGNSTIETIDHSGGSPFGDKELSKCCGKKVKPTPINQPPV